VKSHISSRVGLFGVALIAGALVLPWCASAADPLVIKGDGSTFAYPMYGKWIDEYHKEDPGVQFTYTSNGSGAGIHDIMLGTVDFAGTAGPLSKTQMLDFSTHRNCEVLHFPMALGADVPGLQSSEYHSRTAFYARGTRGHLSGHDHEMGRPSYR
jgi:ABC-type phosphate transport system substrate-binding protein